MQVLFILMYSTFYEARKEIHAHTHTQSESTPHLPPRFPCCLPPSFFFPPPPLKIVDTLLLYSEPFQELATLNWTKYLCVVCEKICVHDQLNCIGDRSIDRERERERERERRSGEREREIHTITNFTRKLIR